MTSTDKSQFGLKPSLIILLLCLFWGGVAPSVKIALDGIGPYSIAAWRFLTGFVVICLWSLITGNPIEQPKRQRLALFVFALIFVMQIVTVNAGIKLTLSSYAVVLLNTSPLFVALLAHWWIPGEKLNVRKVIGLSLAFAGVFIIFMPSIPRPELLLGNILCFAAGFLLSIIHIYSKLLVRTIKPSQMVFWEFAYGVPLFFLLSFVFEKEPYNITAPVVGSILYQGVIVAGFCFVTWVHFLQIFPASKMVSFQFSIPVFGVVLSWLILGEPLSKHLLFGVFLVAVGIFLVTSSRVTLSPTDTG
jgi:drug/metabolite transporter (DMT)-like permease